MNSQNHDAQGDALRNLNAELSQAEKEQFAANEDVISISKRLIQKNRQAYKELAK